MAAGRGERLRPLTDISPKPLLKIGPYSLIEHHLRRLHSAGFKRCIINVSWLADKIKTSLGNGEKYGLKIVYSEESDGALETAGGIRNAIDLIHTEKFIVISADIWTDIPLKSVVLHDTADINLLLTTNPAHHPHGDFGLKENRLMSLNNDITGFTYTGIGCYHRRLFEDLAPGFCPLRPIIEHAIVKSRANGMLHTGQWIDIGTKERLNHARMLYDMQHSEKSHDK